MTTSQPQGQSAPTPSTTSAAKTGMAWYNGCSEAERACWHAAAGSAVPADAYRAFCQQTAHAAVARPADERETFEAWARAKTDWNPNLERKGEGYAGCFAQTAWDAWRARAAAPAHPAEGVPAAPVQQVLTDEQIAETVLDALNGKSTGLGFKTIAKIDRAIERAALAAAPAAPGTTSLTFDEARQAARKADLMGSLKTSPSAYAMAGVLALAAKLAAAPQAPATPVAAAVTDEQIDAILDSPGGIDFVIADKRERMHLFARRVLVLAAPAAPAVDALDATIAGLEASTLHLSRLVDELRPRAERYDYLRNRDVNAIHRGGVFAGMTPDNVVLNGDDLDAAIDGARAAQAAAKGMA